MLVLKSHSERQFHSGGGNDKRALRLPEPPSVALPRTGACGSALSSTLSRALCGRSHLPPAGRGWTRGLVAPLFRHCEPKAKQPMACPRPMPLLRSMGCRGPCRPRNDEVRVAAGADISASLFPLRPLRETPFSPRALSSWCLRVSPDAPTPNPDTRPGLEPGASGRGVIVFLLPQNLQSPPAPCPASARPPLLRPRRARLCSSTSASIRGRRPRGWLLRRCSFRRMIRCSTSCPIATGGRAGTRSRPRCSAPSSTSWR